MERLFQGAKLLSLPQILCISFKRFRASRSGTRKLDCRVTFPESFDFAAVVRDAFAPGFPRVGASLPSGWCACPSKTIVITAAEPLHLQVVRSCGAFWVGHVWTLHSLRPPSIRSTLVSRQRQPRETGKASFHMQRRQESGEKGFLFQFLVSGSMMGRFPGSR